MRLIGGVESSMVLPQLATGGLRACKLPRNECEFRAVGGRSTDRNAYLTDPSSVVEGPHHRRPNTWPDYPPSADPSAPVVTGTTTPTTWSGSPTSSSAAARAAGRAW